MSLAASGIKLLAGDRRGFKRALECQLQATNHRDAGDAIKCGDIDSRKILRFLYIIRACHRAKTPAAEIKRRAL